ncbi:MAG: hypothetical protein M3Y03_03545, partial [Verrucomicrobiota bacterium]|nr:hypothetical protein [Verrucomicrobiota bacterium]
MSKTEKIWIWLVANSLQIAQRFSVGWRARGKSKPRQWAAEILSSLWDFLELRRSPSAEALGCFQ